MSRSTGILITVLVSLLIAGSVYAFLQTHEKKQKTIHTGLFGEARKNPLYAGRVFLKRMGIPTETKSSFQGLTGFPSTDTVLLINSKRSTISPQRTRQLINWVKSGGHLIALATHNWSYHRSGEVDDAEEPEQLNSNQYNEGSPDPLQNHLGIHTGNKIHYDDLTKAEQHLVDKIKEEDDDYVANTLFKIRLKGVSKELSIANSWYHPIIVDDKRRDETETIKLRSSNFMARQKIGKGLVTLVSSLDFIENKQIEKADHAEILWYLIHGLHTPINQPAAVWLIHSDKMPPLWDLLWRNAWMLILSLSFLFVAWLLSSARRFGPTIPKLADDRRSLNEHISSSGNFYWKHNSKQKLLESSRKALMQKLRRIHPGWLHLSETEQINLLAQQVDIKAEEIHHILFAPNIEHSDDFTKTIHLLEKLRHSK